MTENRTFWKTVKPFLTDKTFRITLIEEERVTSQDHLIAKTLNEYFINIPIKNMPKNQEYESFDLSEKNPVSGIIKNIKTTPVLTWLKLKANPKLLDFGKLILMRSKKFIEKLGLKKASQKSDMSTNIL